MMLKSALRLTLRSLFKVITVLYLIFTKHISLLNRILQYANKDRENINIKSTISISKLLALVAFPSIGKLFKSENLTDFIRFFLMFYKDKPIDWLLGDIIQVKMCNPGETFVSMFFLCKYQIF